MKLQKVLERLGIAGSLLISTTSAQADSMSCNSRIVSSGDTAYQVRSVCGEPDAANRRVEYRTVRQPGACIVIDGKPRCESREITVEVVVDEWTYDFGKNRFIQYLTFEQGRLLRVDSGGYGHKQ